MTSSIDAAILALLPSISSSDQIPSISLASLSGGTSSASTYKLTLTVPHQNHSTSSPQSLQQQQQHYFLKISSSPLARHLFAGEHASLTALSAAMKSTNQPFCPKPLGHGTYTSEPKTAFLLTEFIDLNDTSTSSSSSPHSSPSTPPLSLAAKLATLHSAPLPIPDGQKKPMFGFETTTFCGDTSLENGWCESWSEFFAERRLRVILRRYEEKYGEDGELRDAIGGVCERVVGRLLGDDVLNPPHGPVPSLLHGDLWSGNTAIGVLPSSSSPSALVFDASSFHGASEFEAGIMTLFPGGTFTPAFWKEYHALRPKWEPVGEYEDRVGLYRGWHELNHAVMFGGRGSYRSSALRTLRGLIAKYGES